MLTGRKPIGSVSYMGGVPAVMESFCWSWGQMIAFNAHYVCRENEFIHLCKPTHSYHSWARNDLSETFLGAWLLMLDTDHQFEPDILGRMLHRLNDYKLDVLAGVYQFKTAPHAPVLYGWHDGSLMPLGGWGKNADVQQIGGAGAGCLLIRRRVFERIRDELKEKPFDVIGQLGEDLSFFHRLKKIGLTPFMDVRIECHHLKIHPVTMKEYDPSEIALQKVKLPDAVGYVPNAKE